MTMLCLYVLYAVWLRKLDEELKATREIRSKGGLAHSLPPIIAPAPAPPQATPQNVVHGNVNVINQASWGGMAVDDSDCDIHASLGTGHEPGCAVSTGVGLGGAGGRGPFMIGHAFSTSAGIGLGGTGGRGPAGNGHIFGSNTCNSSGTSGGACPGGNKHIFIYFRHIRRCSNWK